ncbi:MAG: DivIVA domain-containing protein [Acidimicrobiales bacterium]|nr:DivIVA domain-containing protein [Acidimicrobiales bacterium]
MESKTQIPSFTISLRGYDREEVDGYLDSLTDALGHVDDTQEQNRRLQAHVTRLNARIKDLEDRINADIPKTGAILAERIGILLRSAEDTATDTINRAEADVAEMIAAAEAKVAEAEEEARAAVGRGEEQARRIETTARGEAAEIISEAEARATTRTRQIEQWAEQVVSHTRSEEARMLREHQEKRKIATTELRDLADRRDAAAATLANLREALGQALGLVGPPEHSADPAGVDHNEVVDGSELSSGATDAEMSEPVPEGMAESAQAAETDHEAEGDGPDDEGPGDVAAADDGGQPEAAPAPTLYDAEADGMDPTGEHIPVFEAASSGTGEAGQTSTDLGPETGIDQDDFDAKFEAWVSQSVAEQRPDGPRHFRRD